MPKAVLWDLDGTLVDSEEYHWRAWHDAIRNEGVEITHAQFLETFGWRNDRIISGWLPDADAERVQRVGDAKEKHYRRLVRQGGLEPLRGAADWVRRLRDKGYRQAVASSAPRANIDCVLEVLKLRPYFDAEVSAEDVKHGKPDPEVFLKGADLLGVEPARCVVMEDAPAGVEAGRRAGMKVIGVTNGKRDLQADVVVRSLSELPADTFETLLP